MAPQLVEPDMQVPDMQFAGETQVLPVQQG